MNLLLVFISIVQSRVLKRSSLLARYGSPKHLQVAAFCDSKTTTIVVPVKDHTQIKSSSWGSLLSPLQVQLHKDGLDCAARSEPHFFGANRHAYLARAAHSSCNGHTVFGGNHTIIYSNRLILKTIDDNNSIQNNLNVLTTCVCNGISLDCYANARWETDVLIFEEINDSYVGGYSINSGGIVADGVDLIDEGSYILFESYGPESKFLWPWNCIASQKYHLIVDGCPLSPIYDFAQYPTKLDFTSEIETRRMGYLAFGFNIAFLASDSVVTIECEMAITDQPFDVKRFCSSEQNGSALEDIDPIFPVKVSQQSQQNWIHRPSRLAGQSNKESDHYPGNRRSLGDSEIPQRIFSPKFVNERIHELFREAPPYVPHPDDPPTVQTVPKYRPPAATHVNNRIGYGDRSIEFDTDTESLRHPGFLYSGPKGIGGAFVDLDSRRVETHAGAGAFNLHTITELYREIVGVGVGYKDWGFGMERNNKDDSVYGQFEAPNVTVKALADLGGRNYGANIEVKDFGFLLRHDFDEHIKQDPSKLATEFMVAYKSAGVAVGTDIKDTKYGVSVGLLGYQMSVLKDFNDRQTDFQGNFGDGWQLYTSYDAPDANDRGVRAKVGFGKLDKIYVDAGAGIKKDMTPELSTSLKTKKSHIVLDFNADGPGKDKRYATALFNIGKFSYRWKSDIALENIYIPLPNFRNPSGFLSTRQLM